MPIKIPDDDPFYKFFNRKCLEFARLLASLRPGCTLGPRSASNTISAFIDAGFLYGSTSEVGSRLRTYQNGLLKSTNLYKDLGLKDLLPMKTVEADVGCMSRPRNLYCFDAGDERVNEQLALAVMHTLWMREHNKVAGILQKINPHWDDETLFQETRHLVTAQVQHIVINEWLPMVIGPDAIRKYGLEPAKDGYYHGYDPKVRTNKQNNSGAYAWRIRFYVYLVFHFQTNSTAHVCFHDMRMSHLCIQINAAIRQEFQSAAFRFGHTLLPDVTDRYNKFHEKIGESFLVCLKYDEVYAWR